MKTFSELGISKAFGKALYKQGITEPTSIQQQVIPVMLENKNVFVQAQTGSGKTLSFLLPLLQKVDRLEKNVQALILTPTRELAIQITVEIEKMTVNIPEIQALSVYGGKDVNQQIKKLQSGMQIIVATPGRLLDHIKQRTIDLSTVHLFILDEGDEMLRMGFLPEVKFIKEQIQSHTQMGIFSATLNDEILSLSKMLAKEFVDIRIEKTYKPVQSVEQQFIETTDRRKFSTLCELLETERPFMAIIFCRTKVRVQKLYDQMKQQKYNVAELHGDVPQGKRERVIKQLRELKLQYVVATDVASRGIDIEGITHVINYDIPHDVESYIHRIGRTGRAGEDGKAITLYAERDIEYLDLIQNNAINAIKK